MEVKQFETGAVRSTDADGERWDLIPWRTVLNFLRYQEESRNTTFDGLQAIQDAVESNLEYTTTLRMWLVDQLNKRGRLEDLAKTFHEGAHKYTANNYKKGFPAYELLSHAARHLYYYLIGDNTDRHYEHAVWNIVVFFEQMETHPELFYLDDPKNEEPVRDAETGGLKGTPDNEGSVPLCRDQEGKHPDYQGKPPE